MSTASHSVRCLGLGHTFFSRNPTFSEVFEKNNFRMIGSVFMQYFLSSLLYREIGESNLRQAFYHHRTGVPGVCRYLWCARKFKNVKVWTKSFRMVPVGAPYDKNSLIPVFSRFGRKSWFFRKFSKIRKSMILTQNHSTLAVATEARCCRTLLRAPFERILSTLSPF